MPLTNFNPPSIVRYRQTIIAALAVAGIIAHLALRYLWRADGLWHGVATYEWPLIVVLALGGGPLVFELLVKLARREFGSDLLAGLSIVTAVLLEERLAGALVVLMLSGGEALEAFAVRSASSVLDALARRMPSTAHRRVDGRTTDVALAEVAVGDVLLVHPHELCPVDGTVLEGHGAMDESYLTGEPYVISKAPGSQVLSGAINGESVLAIRADTLSVDSRYTKIMTVMRESEQRRPKLRRLGDQLGAIYTPVAVIIALVAWRMSGDPGRFLAVLVVATPCPLLIAIPVAIISAISLAARRGIVIKDPAVLEKIARCRTAIFDKTGTLTYGRPRVTEIFPADGIPSDDLLASVASLERFSKHPLAAATLEAAKEKNLSLAEPIEVHERPGEGLRGVLDGRRVQITSRKKLLAQDPSREAALPALAGGLECVVLFNDQYAGAVQFRDSPRRDGAPYIKHLESKHGISRVMIVSGDRETEVRYLADLVGIEHVYASQTPEQKLELVRRETLLAETAFMGDGINDAPALTAATVGIAFGQNTDVTAEAAGAVVLDSSLRRLDELWHIGIRLRTIALQSAVGGMALSMGGMLLAAAGYLPPVAGAIAQEAIDVVAVLNALRMAAPPRSLTDY